ncbi:iron chelate uptake ABC transporter family permease subunit [Rhizobium sp. SSA_523]|uniref:FecCD family ABC transporter permease n=1 Tax=Rhizobium sp. SSA_523 TaxID=2952477 RepID=UPI002090C320|nr:iron ABC transporter permease [Rhizobium sp. SSA_523]MCO5733221.1 iron ABC transporter permease [Rhizobium sp. SSA_523]WKC21791.1 iron ABC transporter permease [Rhizobium sp. SSA_523]
MTRLSSGLLSAPSPGTSPDLSSGTSCGLHVVAEGRRKRSAHHRRITALLLAMLLGLFLLTLMVGQSVVRPIELLQWALGEELPGLSFTLGALRLPRALLSVLAGVSFGMGGVAFQIMLRNPLASPDIIGISSAASAAAVFMIVVLSINGSAVSIVAVGAALAIALLVYGLSFRSGVTGARLILIGIGVSAMMESLIAYMLSSAASWNLQEAMRWLTGSVNGATLEQCLPLGLALLVFGSLLLLLRRDLEALRLGDETASALGTHVSLTRAGVVIAAVGLIAFATAVTGPIAFVAFLSGPIASRLIANSGSLIIPAALTGGLLVLGGDYAGQFLLPARYPVGVVTGALGAPYLIYLIIRTHRGGGLT